MHGGLDVVTFSSKCYKHNTAPLQHDIKPDRHGNASHRLAGEQISFASESLSGLLKEEDKSLAARGNIGQSDRAIHCAYNPLVSH